MLGLAYSCQDPLNLGFHCGTTISNVLDSHRSPDMARTPESPWVVLPSSEPNGKVLLRLIAA